MLYGTYSVITDEPASDEDLYTTVILLLLLYSSTDSRQLAFQHFDGFNNAEKRFHDGVEPIINNLVIRSIMLL